MTRRSLALALAVVLTPLTSHATDLLQVYEMARNGDPQLSSAESERLYTKEGQVQARAALRSPATQGEAAILTISPIPTITIQWLIHGVCTHANA